MKKTIIAAAGIGALVLWPNLADAHHPEITVSSTCVGDNLAFVNIHTEAWKTWPGGEPVDAERRVNTNVVVTIREANMQDSSLVVGQGAFNAQDNYQFDVTTVQPVAAGPVVVRVTSVANWGSDGQYEGAGEFREAAVDLTDNCKFISPTTTTTQPPDNAGTTIVRVPTTTVVTPTTTVPPATPVPVIPKFAG